MCFEYFASNTSAVCRSQYQLEYRQAQDILEGRDTPASRQVPSGDKPAIKSRLEVLHHLAAKRRSVRIEVLDKPLISSTSSRALVVLEFWAWLFYLQIVQAFNMALLTLKLDVQATGSVTKLGVVLKIRTSRPARWSWRAQNYDSRPLQKAVRKCGARRRYQ